MKLMSTVNLSPEEQKILRELKLDLVQLLGKERLKLILFGSKSRGDYGVKSDTDVAIIIQDLTKKLKNLILERVADLEFKHAMSLSVLVLSDADFDALKKRERAIALNIEREGIAL